MEGIRGKTGTRRLLGISDFIERLEGQHQRLFKLKSERRPKRKIDK